MGLFFDYNKPGPGVEKNAPKKKGIALYFELLWRNIGKLMLSNILYFAVSLPVIVLYFMIVSYFLSIAMPEAAGTIVLPQIAVIITVLVVTLWGTGPVSCGYTYILRNTAREEHTFLFSDFFEKSKESFRHGLVFLIVDVIMLICSFSALLVYGQMAEKSGGIYTVLFAITVLTLILYTSMHFYMYEFAVTFTDGVISIYKNSIIMAFATIPMCILLGAIICFLSFILLGIFMPTIVIILALVCWVSIMRFIVDFYTARVIKSKVIDKMNEDK